MINIDSNINEAFLTAAAAARRLGVRKETLYAYVSRGFLQRFGGPRSRGSLYSKEDVDRLRARRNARAGHAAVAASALRWGEPVLDTFLCNVLETGHTYRGLAALELARDGIAFERVAEHLWSETTKLPEVTRWSTKMSEKQPKMRRVVDALAGALMTAKISEAIRLGPTHEAEMDRARSIVSILAQAKRRGTGSIAEQVARSLRVEETAARLSAINAALVLLADHELNASSFAARVAASTGADLYECVAAALATASGPKHGTASLRVEALTDSIRSAKSAEKTLADALARGEALPGFGHPLYPKGDPRAVALLDLAKRTGTKKRFHPYARIFEAAARLGAPSPNVDAALAAFSAAIDAPGAGPFLFLVGRSAGWIAHAFEQRRAGFILRPRARYVGVQVAASSMISD